MCLGSSFSTAGSEADDGHEAECADRGSLGGRPFSSCSWGRQANRGIEGLAISPVGDKLYGIMQSALIQDGALDAAYKRVGMNNRILEVDLARRGAREFVYPLESAKNGVNEILAVNDHQFLVIGQDSVLVLP